MERNKIIVLFVVATLVLSPLVFFVRSPPALQGEYTVNVKARIDRIEENIFLVRGYVEGVRVLEEFGDYYLVEANDLKRLEKEAFELYALADVEGNVSVNGVPITSNFRAFVLPFRREGEDVNLTVYLAISGGRVNHFVAFERFS